MFVLIVKEEQEKINKCMNGIKTCLQAVSPHVTVQHKSLLDLSGDRSNIKCDKVIFLLSTRPKSLDIAKTEWIAKLRKLRHNDFIIVRCGAAQKSSENTHVIKKHRSDIVNNNNVKDNTNKKNKRKRNQEVVELTDNIKKEDDLIEETVKKVLHNDPEPKETDKSKRTETNENQEMVNDRSNEIEELAREEDKETDQVVEDNIDDTEKLEEMTEETEQLSTGKGKGPKSGRKSKVKRSKGKKIGIKTKANKKGVKDNTEDEAEDKENETLTEDKDDKTEAEATEDKAKETDLDNAIETGEINKDSGKKSDTKMDDMENVTRDAKETEVKTKDNVKEFEKGLKFKVKHSKVAPLFENETNTSSGRAKMAESTTLSDYHTREVNDKKLDDDNKDHICISNFEKELFKWWPSILEFLFGKRNKKWWGNEGHVPSYCLHHLPDSKQTAHPITRQVLTMLQTFGAQKTQSHNEDKQCCLLLCKDARTTLQHSQKAQLVKTPKHVQVFAIALYGSNFSEDIATIADRCFTRQNLMNLILALLTELNLINAEMKHHKKQQHKSEARLPTLLYYFMSYAVFILNIPALLVHLATTTVYLWPVFINLMTEDPTEKIKYINYGFVVSSTVTILTVIITEASVYPDFFPYPISVIISVYLLIWQIGVGINLQIRYNYKYGIFSIPSHILKNVR